MIITENPFVAVEEGDVKNGPSTLGTPPTGGLFCAVLAHGREAREADCGKAPSTQRPLGKPPVPFAQPVSVHS